MNLYESFKKNLKESENSRLSVDKIAKFLEDAVNGLIKSDEGCYRYILDDELALYVGWSAGWGKELRDDAIQSKSDPNWAIEAGIKMRNDSYWADFEYLDSPWYENGEVYDANLSMRPNENYKSDAEWFIDCYNEIKSGLESGELIYESTKLKEEEYYGDPNDDPAWHHEIDRDTDDIEVKYKNPGKQTVSGDKVTSEDLNDAGVNYEIDINGNKYYLTCFWSSNEPFPTDDWSEEAAEWESPDDVWGIYYEIYNSDGSENDGGELLTYDLGEWDATELCKDMLGLSGFNTAKAKIKHLDNGNYEDVISFNESEFSAEESSEQIIDMKDACYDIADIIDKSCGDRIQDLPNGDGVLKRDDFDEEFVLACEKVLGLSDEEKDKFWENGDAWEYENYVRGILSYSGYETIFEDDDERGVEEGDLVKYRGINESQRKSLGMKFKESEKVSVRLATNIDWETDGDKEALRDLPKEVELPDWVSEDEVADYLSDEYGWLVNGVDVKTISKTFESTGKTVKDYLDYELEDDDTETGGVSFAGETVRDFIEDPDMRIKPEDNIEKLNAALEECGIRPIKESDDIEVIGFNNQFNTTVKQARIDHKNRNYKTGSFKMINDKKMRRKDFYNRLEELNRAGYKEVKEADGGVSVEDMSDDELFDLYYEIKDDIETGQWSSRHSLLPAVEEELEKRGISPIEDFDESDNKKITEDDDKMPKEAKRLKRVLNKLMSYTEWKGSPDYWVRLSDNYGVDSETDLETHEITDSDIWALYREYETALIKGGRIYEQKDLDDLKESDIKIPRNARKLKMGDDEYFKDGSHWGKTSEKGNVIPTRYPTSVLKMMSKMDNKPIEVTEVDENYKPNRTYEEKVLQGDYGSGWDDLVHYDTRDKQQMADLRQNIKDYRDNEPNIPHRVITRRVPLDEAEISDMSAVNKAVNTVAADMGVNFSYDTPFEYFYAPDSDVDGADYADFYNRIFNELGYNDFILNDCKAEVHEVSDGENEMTLFIDGKEVVFDVDAWDGINNVIDNIEAIMEYLPEKSVNESEGKDNIIGKNFVCTKRVHHPNMGTLIRKGAVITIDGFSKENNCYTCDAGPYITKEMLNSQFKEYTGPVYAVYDGDKLMAKFKDENTAEEYIEDQEDYFTDEPEIKTLNESEEDNIKEFDLEFWIDEEHRDQGLSDTLYIDATDIDEAIAEARKYYNRENWASCELLDDNGEVIFGIYPEEDGGEVDYRKDNGLRESVKSKLINVMESNNISINGMTVKSLKDGEVKITNSAALEPEFGDYIITIDNHIGEPYVSIKTYDVVKTEEEAKKIVEQLRADNIDASYTQLKEIMGESEESPFYSFRDNDKTEGLLGRLWFKIDNSDKYYTTDLFKDENGYKLTMSNIELETDDKLKEFINSVGYDNLVDQAVKYYNTKKNISEAEEESVPGGLFGRVLEIIESNGWSYNIDENDCEVGIENWSPAGEDIYEYLSYGSNDISDDEKGKNLQNSIREIAENFDADEHAELWIDSRGKNGVPSSLRELMDDAQAIQGMYDDLYKEVSSISPVE